MTNINESEMCKSSDWGPWGDCTEACGGGVQFSTRYPLTEGYNEFECGELSRSRECNTTPCPISIEVEFKYIDYKNATFNGWTDQELESGCDGSQNILRVSDTITLNYSADEALEVGTELEIPANNKLHEYFSVSANGEWVYANGMFLKLKNKQIVDLRECEIFSDPTPDSVDMWCGVDFTTDSFICVSGVSDLGGTFDNSVSDRYYYSQETDSLKTEWTSRNNLLSILYLSSTDPRNSLIGSDIWAVFNKQTNTILYYTVDLDETHPCPPTKSEWIPVHPQTSHTLSLTTECDNASDGEFSCDLKDGYVSGWFEFSDETMFVNSLEKNNVPCDDSANFLRDFDGILIRGSGFPTDEENVFAQINRGHFNISQLSTNPPSVGVSRYFTSEESAGGDVEHKIEIPLNQVVDLVNLKIVSVMSQPGDFDIQVYSIKEQRWVRLDTVNHFTKTQQIVTEVKNDFYDATNPPLDASDTLIESVVAIRIYVGNYDYENNTSTPIVIANNLQGLLLHSIRVEGRVDTGCSPAEIAYITNRDIKQITPYVADESPRFYRNATEIVGNGCVGDLLYGNYRYEGRIDAIGFEWHLNNDLVTNTRHIHTDEYKPGDELKFSVTFTHSNGKTDVFSSSLTLSNCKLELFPVNDNSADFLYVSKSHDNDSEFVMGFPTASDACTTTETNKITFHWKGNLEVGDQLSTEKEFATTEKVTSGHQYFSHRGDNYVIKLNSDMQVAEIVSCSPTKFDLELNNKFAIDYKSVSGTSVGTLIGSPNTDIKYFLNTTTFGIHNDLFRLEGLDPVNNIQNMNLVLDGDISEIGTEAKISVLATSHDDIGELEKNFTINIHKVELDRFADCVRLTLDGFDADIINGNYGLVFEDTSQQTGTSGYQTYNQKLVFRTNRRYTDGFLLMDGTVELGAGYIYSQIRYSSEKTRWEVYVYSDDTSTDTSFNESFQDGRLCAFSAQTQLDCPVGMGFSGISTSYGGGMTIGNGEVSFGSDYSSDCSELGLC